MRETELAAHVVDWLTDANWDVYQEVQFSSGGPIADIVAVRNGTMWIIECKTSLGFAVLEQANRWPAHYRSVATPTSPMRRRGVIEGYYKVGAIQVRNKDGRVHVYEHIRAPIFVRHHDFIRQRMAKLGEQHKTFAKAGSAGGAHWTPYKETMKTVRNFVEKNPGCSIGDLYEKYGKMHYSSPASFKGNLTKALDKFEDWCIVDRTSRPATFHMKPQNAKNS